MESRHSRKRRRGTRARPRLSGGAVWRFIRIAIVVIVLLTGFGVALASVFPLPEAQIPEATRVFGEGNRLVARLFIQNREKVPLDQVPPELQQAVIAVEDERFYRHLGIDPIAIGRALLRNIRAGGIVEGGSTITQQLAKNLFLTPERTVSRKIHEALLTIKLESAFDKNQILEMYLNQIYFGHGAYGVEVAAETYFGKSVRDLDLAESALLAGIIRSPENYSPYRNPDLALGRRQTVLNVMASLGLISSDDAEEAQAKPLRLAGLKPANQLAPFFVDFVIDQLRARRPDIQREDLFRGGYQIFTTLNPEMQRVANRVFQDGMARIGDAVDERGVLQPQGALVALDPGTGEIRAMVGGRDYEKSRLNRAVSSPGRPGRQPGSAFKPFLYATLIERGYTTISLKKCEFVSFPDGKGGRYRPKDFGEERYHNRDLTIRESVALSDNVTSVRWAQEAGPQSVINTARRMGVTEAELEPNLPLVLGTNEMSPLELARGYAPLANGGFRVEAVGLLRVVAPSGRTVFENPIPRPQRALSEETAFIVTDMLKSVLSWGTGANLGRMLDRPAAGKTGTTEEQRDAWFVGYTPDLVAAVYVGYDTPKPLAGFGSSLAGPIWASFMRDALEGRPPLDWPQPQRVVRVEICRDSGLLPDTWTQDRVEEVFIRGTEPRNACPDGFFDFFGPDLAPGETPKGEGDENREPDILEEGDDRQRGISEEGDDRQRDISEEPQPGAPTVPPEEELPGAEGGAGEQTETKSPGVSTPGHNGIR